MIFLTTTAIDLDEELLNRCLVLTVNEDRAQTQAIHKLQRERQTSKVCWPGEEREKILKTHRNAQRLLKPSVRRQSLTRAELTFPDNRTRHAPRSREISDADPRHRAAPSAPAGN